MLVIRNGKLVAEAYPHDPGDISRIKNIQSITKSITCILTGIALEEGLLDSLDQTFNSIYPELFEEHPDKTSITIRQVLAMDTGIYFDNSLHTGESYLSDNSVDYVLSRPIRPSAVKRYQFNDGYPQLLSYAIERRYSHPLSEYAREHLFEKLGIEDWTWEQAREGTTFGAFSLFLKPRDLAKFGLMLLQNGLWQGETIVDGSWIDQATAPVFVIPGMRLGYYFYLSALEEYPGYGCSGHGGQAVYVTPDKGLVVVITAWPYTDSAYTNSTNDLFFLLNDSCH